MDKLEAMETFVAIIDEGSLSAAARSLGKAPPTVVRSLALLEEELGAVLLKRTTRRMALTPEGKTYLERCRQILSDVSEAEALLRDESSELRGELRITAPVLFGQLRVAPLVHSFLCHFPDVQIELVLLDRVVNLLEEGFDLGVRIAHLESSSLIATRVSEVTPLCVASPELLCELGKPKHPSQLVSYPGVCFRERQFVFVDRKKRLSVAPRSRLSTNHARPAILACEQGVGVGQFLSYQVTASLESKRLVEVLPAYRPAPTPVHLVFPHARLLSARQRALLDWLKKGLSARP